MGSSRKFLQAFSAAFRLGARWLRLPNILTLPGDVWVGMAVAGAGAGFEWRFILLAAVGMAYLFGMALNDCVDLEEDRRERPDRPLPSGRIPVPLAWSVSGLLALGALLTGPRPAIFILLGLVILYSFGKKLWPLAAPFLMGMCRAATVWMGAGGGGSFSPGLFAACLIWFGFIASVTWIARFETGGKPPRRTLVMLTPVLATALIGFAGLEARSAMAWLGLIPSGVLLWRAGDRCRMILSRHEVQPADIGRLLELLFPLQIAGLFMAGAPLPAGVVAGLWLIRRTIGNAIPAS